MATSFSPSTTLLILSSLLYLLTASTTTTTANEGNVLVTGDVLTTNSQLSYLNTNFVMQDDCNLVLYNKGSGFESNTHGNGINCTLTLTDQGQFVIHSADGSIVWTSFPTSKKGMYAAVLRPDGQVAIYGPKVWSKPDSKTTSTTGAYGSELANIPIVRNVLFSSQILYNNATLSTRDYTFIMRDDCNLAYVKAGEGVLWESGTAGKGQHCFARLDHRGELAVEDDRYRTVWSSKSAGKDGAYALIVQVNGQAVIYGPVVWSTSAS